MLDVQTKVEGLFKCPKLLLEFLFQICYKKLMEKSWLDLLRKWNISLVDNHKNIEIYDEATFFLLTKKKKKAKIKSLTITLNIISKLLLIIFYMR